MQQEQEHEFSFKSLFVPFTTLKAIHWITFIGIVVYANMLFNGFVWDDAIFILQNPGIHSITNILRFFGPTLFNTADYYRPIPALYFALIYNFFYEQAFYYHLIQVILHIVNSCLLFYLFRKFFSNKTSFFATLLFLVHPIQIESVVYISASQSELFFLFGIVALLVSMKEKLQIKNLLILSISLLLSLLTKETGGLFLIMVLIYQFLYKRERFLTVLSYTIISLICYFFIRFAVGKVFFQHFISFPIRSLSLPARLLNIPAIVFYYIKTIFYPIRLAVDQQWVITKLSLYNFYLPLILDALFFLLILTPLVILYIKRQGNDIKEYTFFILWFLLGLFMLLQIFPLDATVEDRWMYFPLAGFLGIAIVALKLLIKKKLSQRVSIVLICFLIMSFSIRTIIRNTNWYSQLTLSSHDIQIEDTYDNETSYAAILALMGHYKLALPHALRSVAMFQTEQNVDNLAGVYIGLGQYTQAISYYEKAIAIKNPPSSPLKHYELTYENLSKYQILHGDKKRGEEVAKEGIRDYPNNIMLWTLLAVSEYEMHDQKMALSAAEKAFEIEKNDNTQYLLTQIRNNVPIQIKE